MPNYNYWKNQQEEEEEEEGMQRWQRRWCNQIVALAAECCTNAVFVGFDNFFPARPTLFFMLIYVCGIWQFLSLKSNAVFHGDLGFGTMNAVFMGFDNFLSCKTTAVFHVDLGFPELWATDLLSKSAKII